eukprot:3614533-Pleurochrysis_carterae.AAC.2
MRLARDAHVVRPGRRPRERVRAAPKASVPAAVAVPGASSAFGVVGCAWGVFVPVREGSEAARRRTAVRVCVERRRGGSPESSLRRGALVPSRPPWPL